MTTPTPRHDAAGSASALVDAIVQMAFVTMGMLSRIAAENDLSLTQLRALAILRDRRAGMSALADHLGLEKSTVTGLINRAERRGLVERSRSGVDGRATEVTLSAVGQRLAATIAAQVSESLAPMLGRFDADQSDQLESLLSRAVDHMQP